MHAFSDARERRCDDTIRDGVSSVRAKRFSSAPYTLLLRLHFYTQCKGKREPSFFFFFFFFFFFSRCCLESVVEFLLFFVVRRVPVREKEREREMFTVRLLRFEPRCERQRCDRTLGDRLTFPLPVAPIDVATERQKGVTKKATRRRHPRTRPRPHKKKEHHQNPEENTQHETTTTTTHKTTHITVPTSGAIPNTVTSNHPPPIFFAVALNASRANEPMISTLFEDTP